MAHSALVVGCGTIGSTLDEESNGETALTHATAYEMHEESELVGGVDPDQRRREAFAAAREIPAYSALDDALADVDVEVASVCTPPETHASVIEQLLDADVGAILCEKPLTGDSTEAQRVVEACEAQGTILAVNYSRRYIPGCQLASAMLEHGLLGTVSTAVLTYNKGLLDNGSHMVDLARWWFGDASEAEAVWGSPPSAVVMFGTTRCHVVHAGSRAYNHVQVDVYGERGRLQLLDHGRRVRWQSVTDSPLFTGFRELGPPEELQSGLEWMCYFAVDDVLQSLEGGTVPACNGDEALRTLELCERLAEN